MKQDPHPFGCRMAVRILGQMGAAAATPEVIEALVQCLRKDKDGWVRGAAARALGQMGAAAATPEVLQALAERLREDKDEYVRKTAAEALGQMGAAAATPEVLQALIQRLQRDKNPRIRIAAVWALEAMGKAAATPEVLQALVERLLRDADEVVRGAAAEALLMWLIQAHPEVLRDFLRALPTPMTPQETQTLKDVLRACLGAVPAVRALLSDPDPKVRLQAVWALGVVGSAAATPEIIRDLLARRLDEDPNVRTAALEVLRRLPVSSETVSAVLRDIQGDEPEAAEATAWALERLGRPDDGPAC